MNGIEAVTFKDSQGFTLFGMLERPAPENDRKTGVILLSPGIKMRVAPHRLYNKLSAKMVSQGYTVLRFDFYGLGDAEGSLEEEFLADLYGTVQVGRYIDDTRCAISWLTEHSGIKDVVLAGLCGGAVTGLLAAQGDDRVKGLFALGIPVILDSSNVDTSKYLTGGQLDRLHQGYLKRALSLKSWFRLLTFRSDYRVIFKIIKRKFGIKEDSAASSDNQAENTEPDNTNPLFAPAFFDLVQSGKKILLVFSGADRLSWEFDEKFRHRHAARLEEYSALIEEHMIENANHIVSQTEWQEDLLTVSTDWLTRNFKASR